jgi:hypothetical protein
VSRCSRGGQETGGVGGGPGQIVRRSAGEGFGSVRVDRGGEMVVLQS